MLRAEELAARPNADVIACRDVGAYLHDQLGTIALERKVHTEAVDHFTAAVDANADFSKLPIDSMYEDFTVLFGWDLKLGEALESYRNLMDASDKATKVSLRAWFSTLGKEQ
ncbi:uncharacterized protein EDB91DRAFT_1347531 [Suillus paluster]|uniref:uncharacterized protein n=1 Tax=Suillus paluster TaxID=48578 RepID=UPI001B86E69C|nr:uncharacterized protein EDB91DRAFT_1347531 [Suillus paluster]KAG1738909.1 hypothetical protein EDB91DRAFT_1347531 [Suillus paluster]